MFQDVDFVRQNKIAWEDLKGGPVEISLAEGLDPVVDQLWSTFQEITAYASDKMATFLFVIGASSTKSPFCCHFRSAEDLRNKFIKYSPRTFKYDTKSGEDDDVTPEEAPVNEDSDSFELTMEERLRKFAEELAQPVANNNQNEVVSTASLPSPTTNAAAETATQKRPTSNALMKSVNALLACTDSSILLGFCLSSISELESSDRGPNGSISHDRKAKSLISRWYSTSSETQPKPATLYNSDSHEAACDEHYIKRGTLISLNVKIGRGATHAFVPFEYRVLGVYDKSYNKFFMTGDKKKWGKLVPQDDLKKYKIALMMVKRDVVDGYYDVSLHCPIDGCKRKDVCRIINGTMVEAVLGDLKSV